MRFKGSQSYVSTEDLTLAVNAAITLQRPLLVKGEPGTGKTMLALEVARSLGVPILEWHIKSTTKAQQGLYEYDAVSRLRDSQLGDARVHDIHNYIVKGMLWQAFTQDKPCVLLIDEVDKADIEFPNDLLRELDRMEFYVYETRELVKAKHRPIVFITSNNEKELPDAFLRRCFFHYIRFPDKETMEKIVAVHFPQPEEIAAARGAGGVLRGARGARTEEEALDQRAARLAEAAARRGHPARSAALQGPQGDHPAAARRAAEERAGRPPVRAAGVHDAREGVMLRRVLSDALGMLRARPTANPLAEYFRNNPGRLIDKWHHYFEIYHRHFAAFRGRSPVVVEIGVYHGGSLEMWRHYFGRGARIVGIDLDPRCRQFEGDRSASMIGDQADRKFLAEVRARYRTSTS